jgi:hypothetical protein
MTEIKNRNIDTPSSQYSLRNSNSANQLDLDENILAKRNLVSNNPRLHSLTTPDIT